MAEVTENELVPITPDFWTWLQSDPLNLSKLVAIIDEFAKIQGEEVEIHQEGEGPPSPPEIGAEVKLTTKPLTDADLVALSDGIANAIVKDKAIEYVKGFITGLTIGG